MIRLLNQYFKILNNAKLMGRVAEENNKNKFAFEQKIKVTLSRN